MTVQAGVWVIVECRVSRLGGRGRGFEVEVEVKKSRLKSRKNYVNYSFTNIFSLITSFYKYFPTVHITSFYMFTAVFIDYNFHGKKLFLLHLDSQM